MPLLNRRGMSPLIATVLLMAFAVALGGMIMNWSSDLGGQAALDCSGVKLDAVQFCRGDTAVSIRARNTGDTAIASLSLNVDSPGTGPFTVKLKDSQLNKGQALSWNVPLILSDEASVGLVASLLSDGNVEACPEPAVTRKPLPKC